MSQPRRVADRKAMPVNGTCSGGSPPAYFFSEICPASSNL